MIKVLIVDDEILAFNYLKNLINWETHGFEIIGSVNSGKKAINIINENPPDLVITDIRMIGMSGLELVEEINKKNLDIVTILLSSYKDFDYALEGIKHGVSNYLLKHELSATTLINELEKVKLQLEQNNNKKKMYHNYFVDKLIKNKLDKDEIEYLNLGNRFFVMMLHKNLLFRSGYFYELGWSDEELTKLSIVIENPIINYISYITRTNITGNTLMILYEIKNTASQNLINRMIEQKRNEIVNMCKTLVNFQFNGIYTKEIKLKDISVYFRNMARHIRYAPFWKQQHIYLIDNLPLIEKEERFSWNENMEELQSIINNNINDVETYIKKLFNMTKYPNSNLDALRRLVNALESTLQGIKERNNILIPENELEIYNIVEIEDYYKKYAINISQQIDNCKQNKYSNIVLQMMKYIYNNYYKELTLEVLGEEFNMNGVYLGQVFKEEVGMTFLKYLTKCRIDEAKRLLEIGELKVYEVSEKVGYKTGQYFSQIFLKNVGVKPNDYKKWGKDSG